MMLARILSFRVTRRLLLRRVGMMDADMKCVNRTMERVGTKWDE